jgi:hypothetical protein
LVAEAKTMNRFMLRRALSGGAIALISTCIAALSVGRYEMGTWSPAILFYAPLWQSLAIGLLAGLALGSVRRRFRPMPFAMIGLLVGGVLGFVMGEIWIGDSPHFSRNLAIGFLTAAWGAGALIGCGAVGFMSRSMRSA